MDNNKLWLLTAQNAGVVSRNEKVQSSNSTRKKLKVRKAVDNVKRNIKVIVTN